MKIGVIDIGTRAVRLLIANTDDLLEHGFRFSDCKNRGDLTEAARGIVTNEDGNSIYQFQSLEKTARYITHLIEICNKEGIAKNNIYIVGTELFRRVSNWMELVDLLETVCGLRVMVLDPIEEAQCTFWAASVSCMEYYRYGDPILVVEQGGGSVQLTVASHNENGELNHYGQCSIPELGTVLLRRRFFETSNEGKGVRRVGTVYREVMEFANGQVERALSKNFDQNRQSLPKNAFALGSVITNFYKGPNRQVHGRVVNNQQLEIQLGDDRLLEKYARYAVNSLIKDAQEGGIPESLKDVERLLEKLYGLPCYAAVLSYFGLDQLRICGTGLRYGVYFRLAYGQWRNIRQYVG